MKQGFLRLLTLFIVLFSFILFSFIFFSPPEVLHSAAASDTQAEISLEAKGAILIEPITGKVLYEKNSKGKLYPASTTKILTALIALEMGSLEDVITLGREVDMVPWDSSKAHLKEGEVITLRELMMGLMLPSGNDAAAAIGVYIARKISHDMTLEEENALDKFTQLMNERAKEAGATGSNFANTHGYHSKNHYTTAHDMALITREAMKNDFFRDMVRTVKYDARDIPVFNSSGLEATTNHVWRNSNALINESSKYYYEYATGIKTGFTTPAGHCLVSSASKEGLDLISVVLGSSSKGKWEDAKDLFEYGFENYGCYKAAAKDQALCTLKVANSAQGSPQSLTAVFDEDFAYIYNKNDLLNIKKSILWDESLLSPLDGEYNKVKLLSSIDTGQVIGKAALTLDGVLLKEINLKAWESIERQSILSASTEALVSTGIERSSFPGSIFYAAGILILLRGAISISHLKKAS